MKKVLSLILTAVLMLTPMTCIAAENTYPLQYVSAEKANSFEDAVYDVVHSDVVDWSEQVVWELSEDVSKLEDVEWESLSDEELTEVINHSTYEEVGWFLLGLSDDEFEEILERDTTLIYPIYTFQDTGETTIDENGEKVPVQEQGILAEHYYEHAIRSVMTTFKWEDTTGTYTGTASGYFYFRIKQDGTKTTDLTVRVYNVTAGQGTVSNYEISGTYGSWKTTSVKSEKINKEWAGIILNGKYTKPAHYYTLWSSSGSGGLGRYDPWNSGYTEYTLDYTHSSSNVTDTVRIQVNGCNAGMVEGFSGHYKGTIDLVKYNNALKINPNGGTHGGKTSTYILATKTCKSTTSVANPTRAGYEFTGWTLSNGTGAAGSLSGTTFTHCNKGATFSTDTDVYSNTTVTTTLKANWVAKDYPYEVRHYKQRSDGSYPDIPDETVTGTAGNDSSFTGALKNYSGYITPKAQTITIGSGSNVISYYYKKNTFDLKVNPNGGTWRGNATPTTLTIATGDSEIIADPIPPIGANVTLYYHDDDDKIVNQEVRSKFSHWEKSGGGIFDAVAKKFTSGNGNASLKAEYTGGSITLPVLSREHYTFYGWDPNPDIGPDTEQPKYQPGETIPVSSNMELHAIWKVDFELDAYIERVLSPHDPVFENGEMGVLKVSLVGFVNKVDVTFPYEMSRYDGMLSTTHTLTPKLVDDVTQEFYIPLYSAEGGYRVTVTAYNEEGDSLTVYPNLTIVGSILDDFRTRLR